MTVFDYIILVILVFFIIKGYRQGFVKQAMAFIGMAAGLVLAWKFYPFVSAYGIKLGISSTISMIVSFILIYWLVQVISHLLGNVLHKTLKAIFFGWLNKIAGGALGMVEGALLVVIILVLISFTPLREPVLNVESGKAPIVKILKKIASPFSQKIKELYENLPIKNLPGKI